jgi:hypothetical protein
LACAANRTAPIRATDALARALSRRNWRRFMFRTSLAVKVRYFRLTDSFNAKSREEFPTRNV